jgi:hypothetical protein
MLLVMESGDGYLDGNVTYDSEKRTFEVKGCDIDAFREYIEALVIDGVPALRAGAANQVEGKSNDHIELLAVLRERSIESSTGCRASTIRSKLHGISGCMQSGRSRSRLKLKRL